MTICSGHGWSAGLWARARPDGTHVAGIVAATANNTVGVCPGCTILDGEVAATAALAWSSHAGATNTSVGANVESTADKVSGTGTYWKYGRVNADRAVK